MSNVLYKLVLFLTGLAVSSAASTSVKITCTEGSYPGEVRWQIKNSDGDIIGGVTGKGDESYSGTLATGATFTAVGWDTAGDGWDGSTLSVTSPGGTIVYLDKWSGPPSSYGTSKATKSFTMTAGGSTGGSTQKTCGKDEWRTTSGVCQDCPTGKTSPSGSTSHSDCKLKEEGSEDEGCDAWETTCQSCPYGPVHLCTSCSDGYFDYQDCEYSCPYKECKKCRRGIDDKEIGCKDKEDYSPSFPWGIVIAVTIIVIPGLIMLRKIWYKMCDNRGAGMQARPQKEENKPVPINVINKMERNPMVVEMTAQNVEVVQIIPPPPSTLSPAMTPAALEIEQNIQPPQTAAVAGTPRNEMSLPLPPAAGTGMPKNERPPDAKRRYGQRKGLRLG